MIKLEGSTNKKVKTKKEMRGRGRGKETGCCSQLSSNEEVIIAISRADTTSDAALYRTRGREHSCVSFHSFSHAPPQRRATKHGNRLFAFYRALLRAEQGKGKNADAMLIWPTAQLSCCTGKRGCVAAITRKKNKKAEKDKKSAFRAYKSVSLFLLLFVPIRPCSMRATPTCLR